MAKTLGEFEQLILFALLDLTASDTGAEAYGVTVRRTIEERTGRRVSSGAVYTALDRLEDQGLISTWTGDPTPERGGRRKRLVRLEPAGLDALDRTVRTFEAMTRGLMPELERRVAQALGKGRGS